MYDYIKANRGALAVELGDLSDLLEHLPYTNLRTAILKSQEECLSTYVVDELLKSDIDTINCFIAALKATDQDYLLRYFVEICHRSDKCLHDYTSVVECDADIPPNAKLLLQNNYCIIRDIYCIQTLIHTLKRKRVISKQCFCKIIYQLDNKNRRQAVSILLDAIINGNNEQYNRFVAIAEKYHSDCLPYIR